MPAPVTQIILANLKISCSKVQSLSGNLGPPNLSDGYVSCTATAIYATCIFADPLQTSHAFHRFWRSCKTHTFGSLLTRCRTHCPSDEKRRLQKWCGHGLFLPFWLENVPRAKTTCDFSTSRLQEVLRGCRVLPFSFPHVLSAAAATSKNAPRMVVFYVLTSKYASRRSRAHFFDISTSKSGPNVRWLRARHFNELTFRPSGATKHWKNIILRLAHLHLLSSDSFFSLVVFLLPFSSLTLPTSAFPSVHIVGVWLLNFLRSCDMIFIYIYIWQDNIYIYIHMHTSISIGIYIYVCRWHDNKT